MIIFAFAWLGVQGVRCSLMRVHITHVSLLLSLLGLAKLGNPSFCVDTLLFRRVSYRFCAVSERF